MSARGGGGGGQDWGGTRRPPAFERQRQDAAGGVGLAVRLQEWRWRCFTPRAALSVCLSVPTHLLQQPQSMQAPQTGLPACQGQHKLRPAGLVLQLLLLCWCRSGVGTVAAIHASSLLLLLLLLWDKLHVADVQEVLACGAQSQAAGSAQVCDEAAVPGVWQSSQAPTSLLRGFWAVGHVATVQINPSHKG